SVTFTPSSGGGILIYQVVNPVSGQLLEQQGNPGQAVTLTTDHLGLASVQLQLGKSTKDNPGYMRLSPQDTYSTQVSQNVVDVAVQTHGGSLQLTHPFQSIALPDKPVKLSRTNSCCVGAASPGGPDNVVTDLVALQSLDQYGNSISNQNIQFTLTGSGD